MMSTCRNDELLRDRNLLRIHLFGHAAIQADELCLEVLSTGFVSRRPRWAIVFRKVVSYLRVRVFELKAKDVFLVQEEDLFKKSTRGQSSAQQAIQTHLPYLSSRTTASCRSSRTA